MLKAINTTSSTISANGVIPINIKKNTFPYVSLNNNTITISKAGNYKISAVFNITATGTSTNIGLYNNGVLIPETSNTITTSTTATTLYQMTIDDLETVIPTIQDTTKVNLTFRTTTGLTLNIADVSLIELR